MSILHIWTFSVFVFLKQTKQNIEIYTGFAKNVSSIKMTFCKEKLVYASPPFFFADCLHFLQKKSVWVLLGTNALCASRGICTCKNAFGCWCLHGNAHTRKTFLLMEPSTATCLDWGKNWAVASSWNKFQHPLPQPCGPAFPGGRRSPFIPVLPDPALVPARPCCCPAVKPPGLHPWAGPNLPWPWALQQEAVRKDSSGAIINTGCTVNTSQSADRLSQWGVLPRGALSPG